VAISSYFSVGCPDLSLHGDGVINSDLAQKFDASNLLGVF